MTRDEFIVRNVLTNGSFCFPVGGDHFCTLDWDERVSIIERKKYFAVLCSLTPQRNQMAAISSCNMTCWQGFMSISRYAADIYITTGRTGGLLIYSFTMFWYMYCETFSLVWALCTNVACLVGLRQQNDTNGLMQWFLGPISWQSYF